MTITATQTQSNVALNRAIGRHFDDAGTPGALVLIVGFKPTYVKWVNLTDRTTYEWYEGMANGTTVKTVAAGTVTLDTDDAAISVTDTVAQESPPYTADGFKVVREMGTFAVTIGTTANVQNKQYTYEIKE